MTRLCFITENKCSVRAQPRAFQLRSHIFPGEVGELQIVTTIPVCTAGQHIHISLCAYNCSGAGIAPSQLPPLLAAQVQSLSVSD